MVDFILVTLVVGGVSVIDHISGNQTSAQGAGMLACLIYLVLDKR